MEIMESAEIDWDMGLGSMLSNEILNKELGYNIKTNMENYNWVSFNWLEWREGGMNLLV